MGSSSSKDEAEEAKVEATKTGKAKVEGQYQNGIEGQITLQLQLNCENSKIAVEKVEPKIEKQYQHRSPETVERWQRRLKRHQELRQQTLQTQLNCNKSNMANKKVEPTIQKQYPCPETEAEWKRHLESQKELQRQTFQLQLEGERVKLKKQQLVLETQHMELKIKHFEIDRIKSENEKIFLKHLTQNLIAPNMELLNQLCQVFHEKPLRAYPAHPYEEKILGEKSSEYRTVCGFFKRNCKSCFAITQIKNIESPFHVLQCAIMKMKYREIYREKPREYNMFHGTKPEHLDGICRYNFDKSKGVNRMTVSFARDAYFATHYPKDNNNCNEKVMVLATVLVGDTKVVQPKYLHQFPDKGYTTTNEKDSVIVKFDDASAYPQYIICYKRLQSE